MRVIQSSGATAGWPVVTIDEPVAARSPGTTRTSQPKFWRRMPGVDFGEDLRRRPLHPGDGDRLRAAERRRRRRRRSTTGARPARRGRGARAARRKNGSKNGQGAQHAHALAKAAALSNRAPASRKPTRSGVTSPKRNVAVSAPAGHEGSAPIRCCRLSRRPEQRARGAATKQRDIMTKTKTLLGAAVAFAALGAAAPALAEDVKLGILGDLTGPIESLAPPIVAGAQLAFDHVNAQGGILGGGKIVSVTGDSACDPSVAGPAADKLVNTDQVTAHRRRLLHRRHHRRRDHRRHPGQRRPDLAVGLGSGPDHARGQRPRLPHHPVGRLPGREARRPPDRQGHQGRRADLRQQRLRQGSRRRVRRAVRRRTAARFRPTSRTKTARPTTAPSSASWPARLAEPRDHRLRLGLGPDDPAAGHRERRLHHLRRRRRHDRRRPRRAPTSATSSRPAPAPMPVPRPTPTPSSRPTPVRTRRRPTRRRPTTPASCSRLRSQKNGSADREGLSAALREVASAPGEKILPGEWSQGSRADRCRHRHRLRGRRWPARLRRGRRRRRHHRGSRLGERRLRREGPGEVSTAHQARLRRPGSDPGPFRCPRHQVTAGLLLDKRPRFLIWSARDRWSLI